LGGKRVFPISDDVELWAEVSMQSPRAPLWRKRKPAEQHMKSIKNRQSVLTKLFSELQHCTVTASTIDPSKHTVLTGSAILSVATETMTHVRKEVGKLLGCAEGAPFTAQDLEQLLLVTAAQSIHTT
jgi:hypothetical protein